MHKGSFSGRGLTSLLSAGAFLIMGITGLILYITPQGRIAYWNDWTLMGLSKEEWGALHILGSILFLVAGGFHVYFNWKPLANYLTGKLAGALRFRRELALSGLVLVWVVVSALAQLPPLSYLLDLNDSIKAAWVVTPAYEPPFGHAELLSLEGLARKQKIPLDQALALLREKGMRVDSPRSSLLDLARANRVSPSALYALIRPLEPGPPAAAPGAVWTEAKIEERFAGSGLGRMTLKEALERVGLDPALARRRLAARGYDIKEGEALKQAADRQGVSPIEQVKAMLLE